MTDEHRAEAEALRKLWASAKTSGRIKSQANVGEEFGIGTQGAVSQFLAGAVALSLEAATGFAAALGVSIADFSARLAEEADKIAKFATPSDDEYLSISQMNGYVYGGSGYPAGHEEIIGQLKFRADFLRECGVTQSNGRIIKVRGNSMFPRIPDGSVVLVKTSDQEPVSGDIFAIAHPSLGPIIKRLRMANGIWYADSENPDHKPIPMQEENAKIIGRAVWMGAKL